jgi:hypothetical protein
MFIKLKRWIQLTSCNRIRGNRLIVFIFLFVFHFFFFNSTRNVSIFSWPQNDAAVLTQSWRILFWADHWWAANEIYACLTLHFKLICFKIILIAYLWVKNTLKNNHNHTSKHAIKFFSSFFIFKINILKSSRYIKSILKKNN